MKPSMYIVLLISMTLAGCAVERPFEADPAPPETRAVIRQDGPVSVAAAALGAQESRDALGVSLHDVGIQPIWLRIRNDDTASYWLFPIAIDHDYFIPSEVLRRVAGRHPPQELVTRVENNALPVLIPPKSVTSGMIFVRVEEGLKAVTVQLMTPGHRRDFPFVLEVPGLHRPPVPSQRRIYPGQTLPDLDDAGLIDYVATLPCCTIGPEGQEADPINFVLVGSLELVRLALASRGWTLAEVMSSSASLKMVFAFLSGSRLPYGAVSDLRFLGRTQDVAYQKIRELVAERNHLRLWLAPVTWHGQAVWAGQISRDVGVKLSGRLWPPTTHEIDPSVDEARFYLLQDLMTSQLAQRLSYTKGVGAAAKTAPRRNAENDPYYTDGLRAIVMLKEKRADTSTIELFGEHYPVSARQLRNE
ncbi:LssY C-terminal domain-containing protein [Noviherbaspirillum saxi]|nr:LssY C-terminal domain-containing protein [Noviherbaspirillum saxi]